MNYKEIIPNRALRKFDAICLHNEYLRQNKEFQEQILSWAVELLKEAREDWGKLHTTTMDAVIKNHHREKAHRGAVVRDKKYAQFRKKYTFLHIGQVVQRVCCNNKIITAVPQGFDKPFGKVPLI